MAAEKKYYDIVFTALPGGTGPGSPLSIGGSVFLLTAVPQGLTDQQRIGDKVTGTSLEVNYNISPAAIAVISGYYPAKLWVTRIIIFIWLDDTAPNPSDVTDISTFLSGGLTYPIAPLDHDRKVKRKVLYDKTHTQWCDFTNTTTGNYTACMLPSITRRFSIPLTKLRGKLDTINFQAATTTAVNHIYMLAYSNATVAAAPLSGWSFDVGMRYNYIDM